MFSGSCKCKAGVLLIRFFSFWLRGNVPVQPTHPSYWTTLLCVNQSSNLCICQYIGSFFLCFWLKTVSICMPRSIFTLLNHLLSPGCLYLCWQCWTRCWRMAVSICSLSRRSELLEISLVYFPLCNRALKSCPGCCSGRCTGLQVWVYIAML